MSPALPKLPGVVSAVGWKEGPGAQNWGGVGKVRGGSGAGSQRMRDMSMESKKG